MLNVEERFMIKELQRKGVSISEIARQSGHDRKTVRKVLAGEVMPGVKPRRARERKLASYEAYLEQRLGEGVYNAQKLYEEIKRLGYRGGNSTVRHYVHQHRPPRMPVATVRFETEPGEQGQVDWGHFGFIQHRQQQRRLYAFVMTLGWSRAMYVEFTVAVDTAWFLRCHVHAFDYLGGVPRQILHDNLKTAVVQRVGRVVQWNSRYLDFADYYGFSPHACQPYRAQTKGKVENGIKYVRGNFWPGLRYTDLADLNQQAQGWLNQVANVRVHGTTKVKPFDRLSQEGLLRHGDKPVYDTSVVLYRQSSRDCLISYAGNLYSVPALYAQQRLLVKVNEHDELRVFNEQGEQIAAHGVVQQRNQRIIADEHYHGIQQVVKQRTVRASGARQVPDLNSAITEHGTALLADAPQVEVRPLSTYDVWAEME